MQSAVPEDAGSPESWPSVTVVVPTLGDRADLLDQTLRKVNEQDYPGEVNCIVVLDRRSPDSRPAAGQPTPAASADGRGETGWESTVAVAEAAGAKVIENERTPGLAGSRNSGILAASAEFVAFCDDDDYWEQGKLSAQTATLAANPKSAIVCCGINIEYGDKLFTRVHPGTSVTFEELLCSRLMAMHVSSFVTRRSALLDGVGLVSEEIPGSRAEDYEFLLRLARYGPVLNVPQPWVHVRWHKQRKAMYGRWPVVAQALPWLLDRYPEFRTVPVGYARIAGQVAFAAAASGDRTKALSWMWKTARANPRELRPYLALAVMSGLVRPDQVISWLHERGRGL
jgi:glycosyltransferase involved in cell wall biosynthesis